MSRDEHLDKILAKLDSLIADAKLRTPGRWIQELEDVWLYEGDEMGARCISDCHSRHTRDSKQAKANATFIASCAGNAEAGWVATRAAILYFRNEARIAVELCDDSDVAFEMLDSIIAAWPEEIL